MMGCAFDGGAMVRTFLGRILVKRVGAGRKGPTDSKFISKTEILRTHMLDVTLS